MRKGQPWRKRERACLRQTEKCKGPEAGARCCRKEIEGRPGWSSEPRAAQKETATEVGRARPCRPKTDNVACLVQKEACKQNIRRDLLQNNLGDA